MKTLSFNLDLQVLHYIIKKNDKLIDLYLFKDLSDKELLSKHLELLMLILEKLNLYNDCLGW